MFCVLFLVCIGQFLESSGVDSAHLLIYAIHIYGKLFCQKGSRRVCDLWFAVSERCLSLRTRAGEQ